MPLQDFPLLLLLFWLIFIIPGFSIRSIKHSKQEHSSLDNAVWPRTMFNLRFLSRMILHLSLLPHTTATQNVYPTILWNWLPGNPPHLRNMIEYYFCGSSWPQEFISLGAKTNKVALVHFLELVHIITWTVNKKLLLCLSVFCLEILLKRYKAWNNWQRVALKQLY